MADRINRSQIIGGVILICIGLLFLLNTLGFLTWTTWRYLFQFWPVILIVIGLNVLLKNTRFWWLSSALVIILFIGLVLFANQNMYLGNNHFSGSDGTKSYSGSYKSSRDLSEELRKLKMDIDFGAGILELAAVEDKDKLYNMDLQYHNSKPEFKYNIDNKSSVGKLSLSQKTEFDFNKISNHNDWDLFLSGDVPLELEVDAGAGKIDLDIRELMVRRLDIDCGVSDLVIHFNNFDTEVGINSGASNIKLYIPPVAGVRINTSSVINNNNFEDAGLIKLYKDVYQSKNYGEAKHHIKLDISTSASNINLVYQ